MGAVFTQILTKFDQTVFFQKQFQTGMSKGLTLRRAVSKVAHREGMGRSQEADEDRKGRKNS